MNIERSRAPSFIYKGQFRSTTPPIDATELESGAYLSQSHLNNRSSFDSLKIITKLYSNLNQPPRSPTYYIIIAHQNNNSPAILKRYSEFRELHQRLLKKGLLNDLKCKFPESSFENFNPTVIEKRRLFFDGYVRFLLSKISNEKLVQRFFNDSANIAY
jgi:hypothetical protein